MRRRGPWWVRPPAGCARRPRARSQRRPAVPCRPRAARHAGRGAQAGGLQLRLGRRPRTVGGFAAHQRVHFRQLRRDGHERAECLRGLLRQQRERAPPERPARGPVLRPAGAARDGDAAAGAQGRRQLAHHGLGQQRFARAAFADEAQRLAGVQRERDALQQRERPRMHADVVHLQECGSRAHAGSPGRATSAMPSTSQASRPTGAAISQGASS